MKYSKNRKLICLLYCIESSIINAFSYYADGREKGRGIIDNIECYKKTFPKELDYNVAQHANLLIYFSDVYELYKNCGYKITEKFSSSKIWETYRRHVGHVCNEILRRKTEFIAQF